VTKITIFRNFTVFRIIRQAALNMLRQTPKGRMGVKRMRRRLLGMTRVNQG